MKGWAALLLIAVMTPGVLLSARPAGATEATVARTLETGVVLVASPSLEDPSFKQSVVLICEYRPEGTTGLILNRSTPLLLSEALPNESIFKGTTYTVSAGGPVLPNALLMLFRTEQPPSDARRVLDGIYLGGDIPTATRLITNPRPGETFRAFAGYAGWGPGQLEFEITQGSWAPIVGTSAMIFESEPARLWPDLLEALRAPGTVSLPTARSR